MATRTVKHDLLNNTASHNKLIKARNKVNDMQGPITIMNTFNTLVSVAGIFVIELGIASATFGGIMNIAGNFYESLEDFYTAVHEKMSTNEKTDGGQAGKYIYSATITYKFTSTSNGEKLNGIPTVVYHWKNKPGIA